MNIFAQDLSEYRFIYILRAGELAEKYGDPWEYTAVVVSKDGVEAVIMGFRSDNAPVRALATMTIRLLRSMGYRKVTWERTENGKTRIVDGTRKSGKP